MIALAVVLIAATGVAIVILRFAKGLPVPAPIPMPVIERFDVDPLEITEGDTVRLSWKVTGADTVSIDPLGREVLLQGDMSDQPWALTTYRLTARKIAPDGSEARNSVSAQVIVNPAPTPTPEPQAPIVQLFEATPTEIVAGARTEVVLTWSVLGNATDIQIVGAGVPLTGLSLQDSISLSISDDVFFVLTAYNGDQSSSKHVQIRTVEPTPAPLDTPVPPTPKDTSTPTWTPTPTHAPTNTPTSMWTPTPTHTPTDTPTPTPRPRDMHLIIELDEAPTPFDSHAGVLWAIFSPNVVKYIIPKPQYCGGGLYAGDPKVIYWSPDQENVEHGLSAGQLIELYGECFFDAGQPAVTIPPDAPYFLRIYEW